MDPAEVPGVFDFQAAVHDDCDAAARGDLRPRLADHTELAPQGAGADRDGLLCDGGYRVGAAEDVDDVDWHWHFGEARHALLAEHPGLAGIDRNHAIAVALEVVANEVARAQLVAREPHDSDRSRALKHPLDRERVLVAAEIRHRTRASACSRSQIRSSTNSSRHEAGSKPRHHRAPPRP